MDQWAIPIALIPGIALLILSTSNFILGLNREIKELNGKSENQKIVRLKLGQLSMLSIALVFLYISCALLVLISVLMLYSISFAHNLNRYFYLAAIVGIFISLWLLTIYSIRAVHYRQHPYKNSE